MPFLTIRHVTTYRYRRPVAFGEHRMMLHPRDSHDQRVIQAGLKISPEPASLRFVQDAFGNYVGIARFSRRSKKLTFESIVCLEHSPCDSTLDLENAGRAVPADYSVGELRCLSQYIERHQLDPIDEVGCWARQFLPPRESIGAFELLTRLLEGIHHGFRYRRREAKGIQQPAETLRLGHGSCRDFATLMIEAARSFGLAARFASGYLAVPLDDPQEPTSGSARGSTMPGRKSICQAPAGLISILPAAASATPAWSPLRSCPILATRSRFTAPFLDFRQTISAWRCK